jgi:hypothetical protein
LKVTEVSTVRRRGRQQGQAGTRLGFVLGLGQDAAADAHHGIGGQHERPAPGCGDGGRLVVGQASGMGARQFVPARRLVHVGRDDLVRRKRHLLQKLEPARRGAGQHQTRLFLGGAGRGHDGRYL